jgi:hypothetical protein
MGLRELQSVLARLYTEEALRTELAVDPASFAARSGLSDSECADLGELLKEAIPSFARSLQRKRMGEVRSFLPATCASLGDRLWPLFQQHAGEFHPQGEQKQFDDALAFAESLVVILDPADLMARRLLNYEATFLRARSRSFFLVLRLYRHDIRTVLEQLGNGELAPVYQGRPVLSIWLRLGGSSRLYQRFFFPRFWPGD